jgi:hypothetical protein
VKRPVVWLALTLLSIGAVVVGVRAFPDAFSIVALDISMDRDHAMAVARTIAERDHLGPADYQEAASFTLDDQTQTFVELEGGGKDAFTAMVRDGLYAAYTWRVRHFKEGEVNEATVSFTPDGRPNGFVERIKEEIDHKYKDLNDSMALPGFRKGHAPRNVLERKFGKALLDDLKFELLSGSFEEVKEEKKLEPVGEPELEAEKIVLEEGKPFVFEMKIEVRPTFGGRSATNPAHGPSSSTGRRSLAVSRRVSSLTSSSRSIG